MGCQPTGQHGLFGDGARTFDELGGGAVVGLQNGTIIEQREKGADVPVPGGGQPRLDDAPPLLTARARRLLSATHPATSS